MRKPALRCLILVFSLMGTLAPAWGQFDPRDRRDTRDTRSGERDSRRPEEREARPVDRDRRPGEEKRPGESATRPAESARPAEEKALSSERSGQDTSLTARDSEDKTRRQEQLEKNKAAGDAWEKKTEAYIGETQKGDSFRQVTIESEDGKTRSRADVIYEKGDGTYALVEAKASQTADFTGKQETMFNHINEGELVTVRGEKMGRELKDKQIRISEVWESRPGPDGEIQLTRVGSVEASAEAGK